MPSYPLGSLTLDQLRELVELRDRGIQQGGWDDRERGELTHDEQVFLSVVHQHLLSQKAHLLNEATIWARAIYPLLSLAERDNVRAYAEVTLSATLGRGDLRGEVDGALATMGINSQAVSPYLVVVEAKRGVEGNDPMAQLLGGLLCAAWQNHRRRARPEHRLYGAYTIADVWNFVDCTVTGLSDEQPVMIMAGSREYTERTEAASILLLLKALVAEQVEGDGRGVMEGT
jgi:hypothetical protein